MATEKTPIWLAVAMIISICASITLIVFAHAGESAILAQKPLFRAHVMCAGFGALGASMAALRKLYRALITASMPQAGERIDTPVSWGLGWTLYYLTRPLLGGVLGALSFTLSYVGFQILSNPSNTGLSTQGRYLLYAFSLLAGYSVSHALNRINEVSKEILRGGNSKLKDE